MVVLPLAVLEAYRFGDTGLTWFRGSCRPSLFFDVIGFGRGSRNLVMFRPPP
jgi:hypothetical protein